MLGFSDQPTGRRQLFRQYQLHVWVSNTAYCSFLYRSITRRDFALRYYWMAPPDPFGLSVVGIVAIGGAFCQPKVYFAYVLSISIYILFSFSKFAAKRVVRNNYSRLEMLNLDWRSGLPPVYVHHPY